MQKYLENIFSINLNQQQITSRAANEDVISLG